ncbi:hypothetical protein E2C01_058790 [Portunus trituberculatus]|uniref:Uncharacterized protein n=1 Tax=Portunus trituberculatus TaxID=210409 RepID=A0A5B7GXD8_PORTR|nr:hypothetical protein [Portunus trituberculatus]
MYHKQSPCDTKHNIGDAALPLSRTEVARLEVYLVSCNVYVRLSDDLWPAAPGSVSLKAIVRVGATEQPKGNRRHHASTNHITGQILLRLRRSCRKTDAGTAGRGE